MWWQPVVPDSGIPQPARVITSHLGVGAAALHAFWGVDDPANPMLWSRSVDHGRTWSPLAPFRPGNQPVRGIPTRLLASGSDVVVHWDETSAATSRSLLAVSADHGATWTVRPGPLRFAPTSLLAEGGTILWGSGPWLFSSGDRGASWQGPRAIGAAGTNLGPAEEVVLRLQDGVLHALWWEGTSSGRQAYYARSTDLGASWQPAARPLGAAANTVVDADLLVDRAAAILVWREAAGRFVDRSLDAGASWLPAPSPVPAVPAGVWPVFTSDGASLIGVWQEDPVGGPHRARCVRSPDHGRTWPAAAPIDILTLPAAARHAQIDGVSGDDGWFAVSVRYVDRTWIPATLNFRRVTSTDGGATWSGAGGAIAACRGRATLAARGGFLGGIWQNESPYDPAGYGDHHFDWLAGPRPLGGAAVGTGGRAPELRLDGIPAFGFESTVQLRAGLPGAPAILALGTRRPPVPFLGGQLVIDPASYLFVVLGGATSGAPGAVTQTFAMPSVGPAEFSWQAFALDPGAVGGVAVSAGIEVRIF